MIEVVVFVFHHAEVTMLLLVLFEVIDPFVERPCDVFLRRPIQVYGIEGR